MSGWTGKRDYGCFGGCHHAGCIGHTAMLKYNGASDTVTWSVDSAGIPPAHYTFDLNELRTFLAAVKEMENDYCGSLLGDDE